MEEALQRGWENLVGRPGGPLSFRCIFQPVPGDEYGRKESRCKMIAEFGNPSRDVLFIGRVTFPGSPFDTASARKGDLVIESSQTVVYSSVGKQGSQHVTTRHSNSIG